jgi:hypothetical protein
MFPRWSLLALIFACSSPRGPASLTVPAAPVRPMAAEHGPPLGVVHTEGSSTGCAQILDVHDDGGARLLCTVRDQGCEVRELGPDGALRGRSARVPGACMRWVAGTNGEGIVFTRDDKHQRLALTMLDGNGRQGASLELTSRSWLYATDARWGGDGALYVAVTFRDDLMFRAKRLADARYYLGAVLRIPATLDAITWTRVIAAKETAIAALLPGTRGPIDALVNFRGTLRTVGPPQVGSGIHDRGTARIALDERGRPARQEDWTVEPGVAVTDARVVDGRIAVLTPGTARPAFGNVTLIGEDGAPVGERVRLHSMITPQFMDVGDGTWLISCECEYVDGKLVGISYAQEIGGARRRVSLPTSLGGRPLDWRAFAVRGDRVVAAATGADPITGAPVAVTVLSRLHPQDVAIDLARVAHVNALELAPMRGARGMQGAASPPE